MKELKRCLLAGIGFLFLVGVVAFSSSLSGFGAKTAQAKSVDGVDLTVMEPFQAAVTVTLSAGESGKNVTIDVPSGKLFVVEQISASGSAPSDQRIELALLSHVAPDNLYRSHYLLAERQTISGTSYYKTSQMVKIYGDTPNVYARVSRSAAPDTVTFRFTVSGYFVNK
jgi:hypothetical protein